MNVSIIIINYNTASLVLQCVDSIYSKTNGIDFEVIVVDNGSVLDDVACLRSDTRFALIEPKDNLGFGKANNLGATSAKGGYLLLLNPDTILQNNAIWILWRYMTEHEECGICGGNLFHADMSPAHSYHMFYPSMLSEMDFVFGQIYRRLRYGKNAQFNHANKPIEVAMITGADLMIRRDVWDTIKGFDPRFFMYSEDADLCYRTKCLGKKIVNVPDAHIVHLEGQSFCETEKHCRRILDGRFLYFNKYHGNIYNAIADALNILTIGAAVALYFVLNKKQQKENMLIRLHTYLDIVKAK